MGTVKIVYTPGSYGNYFAGVVAVAGNLVDMPMVNFDTNGASHDVRTWLEKSPNNTKIVYDHVISDRWSKGPLVVMMPDRRHLLDYASAWFTKQLNLDVYALLESVYGVGSKEKILENWQSLDNWCIREFLSIYTLNNFKSISKNFIEYQKLSNFSFSVQDLFSNFQNILTDMFNVLGLNISIDLNVLNEHNQKFVQSQKQHNIQTRCEQFVEDAVSGVKSVSPTTNILEEAYCQHYLSTKGYELMCYNLNEFPKDSLELTKLIKKYEN